MRKHLLKIYVVLVIVAATGIASCNAETEQDIEDYSPYIAVIPQSTEDPTLTPGTEYTISIYTDYDGSDVWGWEFSLKYNPAVLKGINVANGDLITEEKDPRTGGEKNVRFFPGTFDNAKGELSLTGAVFIFSSMPAPLTSGPGVLATVTFEVVGEGESELTLVRANTRLIGVKGDGYGVKYNVIDFITDLAENLDSGKLLDGYLLAFEGEEAPIHDVAVSSVKSDPTSVIRGESLDITITVKNEGTVSENVDIMVYYDHTEADWLIGEKTVRDLAAGSDESVTFTWNTEGIPTGDRTIIAVVESLYGETDTGDNKLEGDELVTISMPQAQPWPTSTIIAVIVVIVIVIAAAYYFITRR